MGAGHKITILKTYYGQRKMAKINLEEWLKYKDQADLIFIDDGYKNPLKLKGATIYRIEEDIPWNQGGARNLGFHVAKTDWILCTDIDHVVTKEVMDEIQTLDLSDWQTMYYLGREYLDTAPEFNAYNVYLMHKKAFEKVGGFDEDFSGCYGYEDTLFYTHCHKNLNTVLRDDILLKIYPGGRTRKLSRKSGRNYLLLEEKLNCGDANTGRRLRFKWHETKA